MNEKKLFLKKRNTLANRNRNVAEPPDNVAEGISP